MHPAPLLVVLALGVDVGWRPLPEGGLEYIIQIEPELLDSLQRGQPIASDVPLVLRDIRRYRIQVGNGPLPQEGPLETPMPGAEPPVANAARQRPAPAAELAEAPRFVAAVPAAGEPAKPADSVAAPPVVAASESPPSKQNIAAAETPDPFASPTGEPATDTAAPPGEETASPAADEEGPLLAAEAAPLPEGPASTADVPPQLGSDEPAKNEAAPTDPSGAQPTTVHKLTSAPGDDDPPLRGGAEPGATGSGSASEAAAPAEPNKPWVWLTLTLMGLAASATVNVYQGFLHLSLRSKYRAVVRKLHDATAQRDDLAAVEAGWPDEQANVETVRTAEEEYYEDDEA